MASREARLASAVSACWKNWTWPTNAQAGPHAFGRDAAATEPGDGAVHNPEIVVLDEPEAGLDPQSRIKVREYIQSLARKKTVILTTQQHGRG